MAEAYKILIDMDIGDDIDDAIALVAAMKQGFDIIGITTVFRNTSERARMTKKLLKAFGNGYENVPVYAGHGVPYGKPKTTYGHTPHYSADLDDPAYAPDGTNPDEATDFIIHACRTYGKQLAVIAIGPFTNMARVIEKDPGALNAAAKVAIMGGAYLKQYADWNVMCDVPAADILFRNVDNLECIGADVTHRMLADGALYESILNYRGNAPAQRYLKELCALWRLDRPQASLVLHDPLVIYYVADPAVCRMKKASIVVLTDGFAKGMTLNVDAYTKKYLNEEAYLGFDTSKRTLFAYDVDKSAFDERILKDFAE
ncbi:MAG: nucleoside hydrolase [Clostridia bacterium]|nr:nucleoside hydrolase [Clostridia bacterium]